MGRSSAVERAMTGCYLVARWASSKSDCRGCGFRSTAAPHGPSGGWWLTTDGFGLTPHLPIALSAIACLLMLHHGFTAERWVLAPRAQAFKRVGLSAVFLLLAASVNLQNERIHDVWKKVTACAFLG